MKWSILASVALLLAAPLAHGQQTPPGITNLDCSGGCTTYTFGLGDNEQPPGGTFDRSTLTRGSIGLGGAIGRPGATGACGLSQFFAVNGQAFLVEMDNCEVSSTNRCRVQIPDLDVTSGSFNSAQLVVNLGAGGVVGLIGAIYYTYQGSLGERQLYGRCVDGNGDNVTLPCAVDADCNLQLRQVCGPAGICQDNLIDTSTRTDTRVFCSLDSECGPGESCRGTCMLSGANCASDADCPGVGDSCSTEIDWDQVGRCEDDPTITCTRANCPDHEGGNPNCECGAGRCFDGFSYANDLASCICCDSTSDVACAAFGFPEYPQLGCPDLRGSDNPIRRDMSDWVFAGGAGTPWVSENLVVPGQQEGHCAQNDQRSCGTRSSPFTGADVGKCTNSSGLFCAMSGGPCTEDADCPGGIADPCESPCQDPENPANPALASECDDVAFGGIEGDFCNFVEAGHRNFVRGFLPDGRQDPTFCTGSINVIQGFPDERCTFPVALPQNDPLPGCRLTNVGVDRRPDNDCDGIDDATQGRCAPDGRDACASDADCASGNCVNGGDLCAFIGERALWTDTNNDGIGDECQCGDANADGAITGLDIGAAALCANGVAPFGACDSSLLDATGDNSTTAEDIGGIVSAVNGFIDTGALLCVRNIAP